MCLAGLTPSQTGGGAAQLYVLQRAGLPLADAVAMSSLSFLASTGALLLLGLVVYAALPGDLPAGLLFGVRATLVLFVVLVLVVAWLLRHGESAAAAAQAAPSPERAGRIRRALHALRVLVARSLETARTLLRTHRGAVLALVPLTALLFLTKFALTFAVFRAFQPDGFLGEFLATQVILVLALFFAPTPGGSGITEASAAAFLSTFLATGPAFAFVVHWRLLTLYVPVLLGGLVLLAQLRADARALGGGPAAGPLDTPRSRN
jgi:uncharacterized protein (TIRG00374 family)